MFSVLSRRALKRTIFLRLCHHSSDPFNVENMHVIKTFDKTIDPFSKIFIETPMSMKIQPLDHMKHPEGDRMILNLYSSTKEASTKFFIKQTPKRVDIVGTEASPDQNAVCIIQAPVRASFQIEASGKSNICVEYMHSDECDLKTTSGGIIVKDVKAQNIKIQSSEGSIICDGTVMAEKIDIRTDLKANVTCKHIRSNDLKVATDEGNIRVDSCYSDESNFTTVVGSLKLGNLHRNCVVQILERGDLTITGFDGSIKATLKRGNVHLQASKLNGKNSIFIHESGLVDVMLANVTKDMSLIELIAKKLNIEDQILNLGVIIEDSQHKKFRYGEHRKVSFNNELYVECRNGTIDMKLASWQEMLKKKGIEFDK